MATISTSEEALGSLESATVMRSPDTLRFLRDAAQKRGVSTGDMVRIALGTQKFLTEEVDKGAKVQLNGKNGVFDVTI